MPTIKDVAKRVGVSTATVSHVINKTRFVSDDLTRRVLEVIRELHYQPNAIARSLVKRKTHTIGLIITDILNPFYTAIVRGIEDVTYRCGYSVMLCNTDEDPEKEILSIRVLLEKRIDGLILSTAFRDGEHPLLSSLRGIPLVTIVRRVKGLNADAVLGDNTGGAYQATDHLLRLGHRRIGIISGPTGLSSGAERLKGYRKAMEAHRIPVEEQWIQIGDFKRETGYALTKELAQKEPRPTALFVANNQMAVGALQALHELNLSIPGKMSFISFDDMEWYAFLDPPLSAVEHSPYLMGKTAGEVLLQRITRRRKHPRKTLIPSHLIIRESTAKPVRERR